MPARFVAACCLLAILSSVTFAAAPVVEPTGMWSGKIKDESLRKLAPKSGFIADAETWKTLWTAWRPDEEMPKVDFAKELILVGTVPGPNQVVMQTSLTDKGNVKLTVFGTEIAGPGFGYKIIKIGKEGVKTVNGKAVTAGAEDSITVTVVGTLRTGIFAIGGETTGTTITAKGITWELDFGKNVEFRKTAEKLNGKKVVVQGSLERRRGVEIKERWIVTVTGLKGFEKDGTKVGAVEQPARVQVRVLDLQLWTNQPVVKNGVSVEKPYTGWIAVTGEKKRLYASNGFFMDATMTERNGVYEVEFKGCAGGEFAKKVTLKAGKSRVVPLFDVIDDASALENVYMALKAPGNK